MSVNFNSTETEREILNEARRLLGNYLADYLLSGLGETSVTHCRAFTALSISPHSENVLYQLKMINESEQGLPRERDPLVLASMLLKLFERQPLNSTICFPESEIMQILRWPQSDKSRSLVRRALERYLLTAFYLINPAYAEEERIFGRYASFRRLLVGYETPWLLLPLKRTASQGLARVMFLSEFIHEVRLEGKRFLGIEFQKLREMQEIPC